MQTGVSVINDETLVWQEVALTVISYQFKTETSMYLHGKL